MTEWSSGSKELPVKIRYSNGGQAKITIPSPIIEMYSRLEKGDVGHRVVKPDTIVFVKDSGKVWVHFGRSDSKQPV